MAIQWFPGHMNKAKKDFADKLSDIDVVIEMCDARLPMSSSNPMLRSISSHKATLKLLNKQDLADPEVTQHWIAWFQQHASTRALALEQGDRSAKRRIVEAARSLVPHRTGLEKPLRMIVCGIPNVGKSTLINSLAGRKIAKTGNEPAITKAQQRIQMADDAVLYDTPGMMWPKIEHEASGYALAASGAIGRNAMDETEVSLALLAYLLTHYPHALATRYKLDIAAFGDEVALWHDIGRKRGAMRIGGVFDEQKTAELILNDFREGRIGRLSLETPQEWEYIVQEVAARAAAVDEQDDDSEENPR